jgi:hypothetical protein
MLKPAKAAYRQFIAGTSTTIGNPGKIESAQ